MSLKKELKSRVSLKAALLGPTNTESIVAIAIGIALFGVLMVYGGIQVTTNTKLTTAYLIPVIVGAYYGAVPAALVAGVGNVLADLIGGWGIWPDWAIGNAIAGFFIGLLLVYGTDVKKGVFTLKHAVIFTITTVVGQLIAFILVVPVATTLIFQSELTITYVQSSFAAVSNSAVVLVAGIPLLFVLANRNKAKTNLVKE